MSFEALSTSLVFWEVLTFVMLVGAFLMFWPRIKRFVESLRGPTGAPEGGRDPLKTLDRRYANGEIRREEYLTIRDDIKRNSDA